MRIIHVIQMQKNTFYATDDEWAKKIIYILKRHHLHLTITTGGHWITL